MFCCTFAFVEGVNSDDKENDVGEHKDENRKVEVDSFYTFVDETSANHSDSGVVLMALI